MADDGASTPALVRTERDGPVVSVLLDRPEAANALSSALATELRDALRAVVAQRGVRAVVLGSTAERAFCVGADLKERRTMDDDGLRAQRWLFRDLVAALSEVPVPTVAAVTGHALGGGFELALTCDLVVADPAASFGLPEVGVGLVPGLGGTQLLARRVGVGRAADVLLTGRRLDGVTAERMGAVDRVAEAGGAMALALQVAQDVASASPTAVRAARHALRRGLDLPLAEGMAVEDSAWQSVAFSADRREGIAAFTEKRTPRWEEP